VQDLYLGNMWSVNCYYGPPTATPLWEMPILQAFAVFLVEPANQHPVWVSSCWFLLLLRHRPRHRQSSSSLLSLQVLEDP